MRDSKGRFVKGGIPWNKDKNNGGENMLQKEWWKSRTLWVGILTTVGGICTALAGYAATGGTITVLGVVNVILRIVTNKPLK